MRKKQAKQAKRQTPAKPVSLAPNPWDEGANGMANRINLVREERGEINLATGKIENPNRVWGVRRETWVWKYMMAGKLTAVQWHVAMSLRDASEGRVTTDPLAAVFIDKRTGTDPQAAMIDARKMYRAMMDVAPPSTHPVIERVVIGDHPVWRYDGRTVQRSFDRLREALDAIHAVFFAGALKPHGLTCRAKSISLP